MTPELPSALRAMGHGDEIAIVDGNDPATSAGPPVIRLDGVAADAAWCRPVVATGERRLYGNLMLKKGVVRTN